MKSVMTDPDAIKIGELFRKSEKAGDCRGALRVYNYSPFRSARCGAPRGTCLCTLWGWAILHIAVTAIDIDIGHALIAAANRTGTRVPLPRSLRSVRPGRITRINVRVDIGLCIRRLRRGDHCQNAQAADESVLRDFLLWTRRVREATTHPHRVNVPDYGR